MLLFYQGLFFLYLSIAAVRALTQEKFVQSLLHESVYNKMERPGTGEGKPVVVEIGLFIHGISSVSEITMNYHINMFVRQQWKDPRLAFKDHPAFNRSLITLNYNFIPKMWQPDIYLKNEVYKGSLHDVTVPNRFLNLQPDGTIFFSQRISTKLSCNMKLETYPFDTQTCYIELESYGYTSSHIVLHWLGSDAFQVNGELELPEFNLTSFTTLDCTGNYSTGLFSCLKVALHFERLTSYYMLQEYLPTSLIVILSWFSFWLDYKAVPARISVGLLTVLTITTKSSSISAKLPKVSYIKAIDVWNFTCSVFIFAALIEYAVVNVLARRQMTQKQVTITTTSDMTKGEMQGDQTETNDNTLLQQRCHTLCTDKALLLDRVSKYIFPLSFAIFNMIYWIIYLHLHL